MPADDPSQLCPIYWISGPPAAGKSTLCDALIKRFDKGLVLPVDDLRSWVKSGLSESVPWTDETERQFQIAEGATCDIAARYQDAGFAVAIDHCRNLPTVEAAIHKNLVGRQVIKVCLMPDLDENLRRNASRTNKPFGPDLLVDTIRFTNQAYRQVVPAGWIVIDNTRITVEETLELLGCCNQPNI